MGGVKKGGNSKGGAGGVAALLNKKTF